MNIENLLLFRNPERFKGLIEVHLPDNERWLFATDGHRAVGFKTDEFYQDIDHNKEFYIKQFFNEIESGKYIKLNTQRFMAYLHGDHNECSCKGTHRKECEECCGEGQTECEDCNGSGEISEDCEECDGSGYCNEDCDACSGSGEQEVECDQCAGTGEYKEDCDVCSGSGECADCSGSDNLADIANGVEAAICKACLGTGHCQECTDGSTMMDCSDCHGNKVMAESCTECDDGKVEKSCETCDSSGSIEIDCSTCVDGYIYCTECDDDHQQDCDECDKDIGKVYGITLDLALLKGLSRDYFDEVFIKDGENGVIFRGAGRMAIVMPYRDGTNARAYEPIGVTLSTF